MKPLSLLAAVCVTFSAFSAFAEGEAPEAAPTFMAPAEANVAPAKPAPAHVTPPAKPLPAHAAVPAVTHAVAPAASHAAPAPLHSAAPAAVSAAVEAPVPAPAAAPAPAPVPVAAPAPQAKAPAASPSWLRPDKPMAKPALETQHGPSPFRIVSMLLLVAGLGGVAMYARRKRQGAGPVEAKGQLKLLGTTRVGPKATAVVVEVAGKRLLLGVTEQAVSTLAWLDDEANTAVEEREPHGMPERAPAVRPADDVIASNPSGFLKLLRNAVGSGARPGAAIDEVAQTTRDEVHLSSRREAPRREARPARDAQEVEEPMAFEGQVMGLAKRRRESK